MKFFLFLIALICMALPLHAEDIAPGVDTPTVAPTETPAPPAVSTQTTAEVPKKTIAVLQEKIGVDEQITDADVILIEIDKAPRDALTEASQIVGKSPRRVLNANQPIRAGDLKPFYVIKKGDIVTIELQTSSLNLTVTGKSLDNGAVGDAIRVTNLASNRTIFAKVTGPNTAIITQNNP